MKATVDKTKCIGCNMCEDISEGNVGTKFGKDGKAEVNPEADMKKDEVQEVVLLAAEVCPMQAIEIEKD